MSIEEQEAQATKEGWGLWDEDEESVLGLQCKYLPHCVHCDTPMELWDTKLLHFTLTDNYKDPECYAIDVVMYCPNCGWLNTYGVAVSREHGERTRKFAQDLERKYINASQNKQATDNSPA